jgi:hypothetical protein
LTEHAPRWPFPFADADDGRLGRRQWLLLVGAFVLLHYAALGVSLRSGNFDPDPNHDHVRVMRHVLEDGVPHVAIWPPGFGYYLAFKWRLLGALGLPYWTGKLLVDVLIVVAAGALATVLGRLLTRNRILAVASGLGLIAAPIFLLSSAEGLAVLLFQPFFLGSLVLLVRALQTPAGSLGLAAGAGALMGLACLVRANPQFLILALAPAVLLSLGGRPRRRTVLRAAALVAAFFLAQSVVTAPWQVWQRRLGTSGVFTAPVFYYAFVDGLARHPGNRVSDWVRARRDDLPLTFDTVVEVNAKWLREDPAALVRLYAIKAMRTWYLSDSSRWDRAILLLHWPWWLGAVAGLVVWLRRSRRDPALLLVLLGVLYLWGVAALVSGLARYMAPVYGFLGLLGGVAALGRRATLHSPSGVAGRSSVSVVAPHPRE